MTMCSLRPWNHPHPAIPAATVPRNDPQRHCSMSRKPTGGGYAALVDVPRPAIRWTKGGPGTYRLSPVASRGFCEACGSPLSYDGGAEARLAALVGSLDDPFGFRADHHYGIESRLPWADCGSDLPGHETKERFDGIP